MTTAPENPKLPDTSAIEQPAPIASEPAAPAGSMADVGGTHVAACGPSGVTRLAEHKGKLAIGVAATLGLMVYYGWREKRLAQTDPEEYARLQRIKAGLRSSADWTQPEGDGVNGAAAEPKPMTDSKP